jgi:putative inorganic carbon (HCO3(-)) transporter
MKALELLCSQVSLRPLEQPLVRGLEQSRLLGLLLTGGQRLHQQLLQWAETSLAAKVLPILSLYSTLLVLIASPFLDSGPTGLLVAGASLFTLLRLLLTRDTLKPGVLLGLIILFTASGLISTLTSAYPMLSAYGYAKSITYLAAYLCFLVNLRTLGHARQAAWVIIFSATLVALYGLYQWHIKVPPLALWDDPNVEVKMTRVYSFLGNPNLLGGYLLPTSAMTLFFYFGNLGWRKLLLLASLIAQLVCLYFTYSRGAWIALAAGSLVSFGLCLSIFWHIFMNNKALKGLLFGGTALGIVGGGAMVLRSPAIMARIQSLISGGEHSSNQFRINVWNSSFAMIQDFWLTGIGVGNKVFQKIYVYYMATGFHALSTYNIFLEVWVEMGIIGIALFLFMLVVHLARCLWGVVQDIDYTSRLFLAAAFTGLTGLLVHGMVDTIFFRPPLQILFWFLLALIAIVSRDELAYQHQLTR